MRISRRSFLTTGGLLIMAPGMALGAPDTPAYKDLAPDELWLAHGAVEPVIDPDLPIIDAHFHLWDSAPQRYTWSDYKADLASGHNIVGRVLVEAANAYRTTGPVHLRPVGEVEAAVAAIGHDFKTYDAIVGHADLRQFDLFSETLRALEGAAGGRLRGIRFSGAAFPASVFGTERALAFPPGRLAIPDVARSAQLMAERKLTLELWVLAEQLEDVAALAERCPQTTIVVDHVGGLLGLGPYRNNPEAFRVWQAGMRRLAHHRNVSMKLGGLGMRMLGATFRERDMPPTGEQLAAAWSPRILEAIEILGPHRCMFESNFPVDKGQFSWNSVWNAFKIVTARLSATDRHQLFFGTAVRNYHLGTHI